MDKLSTKLDKACIPSPHFSKIAEVFSSSQIDEQEAFSPLLTPRKKTTHGGFFASLLFLLLIGTAAGSGWYFGKQGSYRKRNQALHTIFGFRLFDPLQMLYKDAP